MARKSRGPQFVTYFGPVLEALTALGASARAPEVIDWIARNKQVAKVDIETVMKSGQTRFENQVHWARFYLSKAGYIDASTRGVWALTEMGRVAKMDDACAMSVYKSVRSRFKALPNLDEGGPEQGENFEQSGDGAPIQDDYINSDEKRRTLVKIVRSLSDKAFEEFCARLLRETGFDRVMLTGRPGDQGVDGEGFLAINRFVKTKVLFQCKRYETPIGSDKIRDFRGAITGRAERGIFLTTSTFTRSARDEANRENTTPIELVDLDDMINIMIENLIGVVERKAIEVDNDFFSAFARRPSSSD